MSYMWRMEQGAMTRARRGTCRLNLSTAGKDPPILPSEGRTQRFRVHPHPMPFPGPASLCSVPSCMKPSSLKILQMRWILPQCEWQASCPDPTKLLTAFMSIFHPESVSIQDTTQKSESFHLISSLYIFSLDFSLLFIHFFPEVKMKLIYKQIYKKLFRSVSNPIIWGIIV